MSQRDNVVIVAAKRTPLGSFQGCLSSLSATDLGSFSVKALFENNQIDSGATDEAILGCVLPAGVGQAPARQAVLKAGLAQSIACTTINKVCGSAMKAIMFGHDLIVAGRAKQIIAGGMESMTNAPYLLLKAREGFRLGHHDVIDHMFFDGLENASDNKLMGHFAEDCASKFKFSRQQQDEFAAESVSRAIEATNNGLFANEIAPLEFSERKNTVIVDKDEQPFKSDVSKIAKLKPAFRRENGTVTAANSSSISDGAASVVLMNEASAIAQGIPVLAKIVDHTTHAQAPEDFTTAPIGAITKLLQITGWKTDQVDLFEINEAFAVVTMAAIQELKLNPDKVNVNGGACALGHPIGASGARIVVTLIHALRQKNLKRGIAALCIGGGEATAIAVEII